MKSQFSFVNINQSTSGKDLRKISRTRGSASKSTTTKSAVKWNVPTFTKTSSATPTGREIERSASSRVIQVGDSSGRESLFHTDNGMRFMLASRSAKAKHSSILGKSHGMGNLLVSPAFLKLDVFGASIISRRHRVLCHLGFTFHYFIRRRGSRNHGSFICKPLRVVIPFKSSFGLVMVLLGRVLEPKDEASQLAVEESGLDEPELGNLGIDKPVLDKLE
nr:hypothetical protein [Tanacetum cinerariifolium]